MNLKSYIHETPNFPIPGVLFRDMSPLLQSKEAFDFLLQSFDQAFQKRKIELNQVDAFVGVESRGFILAAALAAKYQKGFVPLRKKGKLPPPTVQTSYELEYGSATLEAHAGHGKVILLDDVLATGGTLQASVDLCQKAGYQLLEVAVVIDLEFLNQFRFQNQKCISLIQYQS